MTLFAPQAEIVRSSVSSFRFLDDARLVDRPFSATRFGFVFDYIALQFCPALWALGLEPVSCLHPTEPLRKQPIF